MKNLMMSFALSVVAVLAARAVVLDKAYLAADVVIRLILWCAKQAWLNL